MIFLNELKEKENQNSYFKYPNFQNLFISNCILKKNSAEISYCYNDDISSNIYTGCWQLRTGQIAKYIYGNGIWNKNFKYHSKYTDILQIISKIKNTNVILLTDEKWETKYK